MVRRLVGRRTGVTFSVTLGGGHWEGLGVFIGRITRSLCTKILDHSEGEEQVVEEEQDKA